MVKRARRGGNHEGTLTQRNPDVPDTAAGDRSPHGIWRIRITLGRDPITGKEQRLSHTIHGTRADALRAMQALRVDRANGVRVATASRTLGDLWDQWLATSHHADRTRAKYESDRRLLGALADVPLARLDVAAIEQHYRRLADEVITKEAATEKRPAGTPARRARRIADHAAAIHTALGEGVRLRWIGTNPADAQRKPRAPKATKRVPSPDEVARILGECSASFAIVAEIALTTGMRRGELAALRWEDIDLAARTITVRASLSQVTGEAPKLKGTKTDRVRVIGLAPSLVAELEELRRSQATEALRLGVRPIFVLSPSTCGTTPYRPDGITSRWSAAAERAGLAGVTIHSLRHLAGTTLVKQLDILDASAQLGHSRVSTTLDIYGSPDLARVARSGEVLDGLRRKRA